MASNDLNKVTLMGNVGKHPEERTFGNNDERSLVKFTLATNNRYKNKESGEWEDDTTWHNIVSFNKHWNQVIMSKVEVGTRLYLEGEIKTRSYKKEGQEGLSYITEIVIPMFGGDLKIQMREKQNDPDAMAQDKAPADFDDDIPF